jgi:hypothetical protein
MLESGMPQTDLRIRCQRCGTQMTLRDPAPDSADWPPQQFWECPRCGRHFWSTYPPPARDKGKPAAAAE